MEFLVGDDDEDDDEEDDNFSTPPSSPMRAHLGMPHIAPETLPRSFCYERRHVQAAAVGMQTNNFHKLLPHRELESFNPAHCYTGYFSLTLRGWYERRKPGNQPDQQTLYTYIFTCFFCVHAVLSDGVMLDVIFFPATPGNLHWKPIPLTHDNTWESVLSHGGFSSHAPPPSPGKNNPHI